MNAKLNDSQNTWVNPDDAPELDDGFFDRADLHKGNKIIRRGRPVAEATKTRITIRHSPDVVEAFRATGEGWQTRMDIALRDWLKEHNPSEIKL